MHLNLILKYNILDSKYEICIQAKYLENLFKSINWDSDILELIHNYIWDLRRISRGGNKYFVIFIDDYSKYYSMYLLKIKDEIIENFKYLNLKLKINKKKIKILRSAKKGEYTSNDVTQYC